MLKKRQQNGVNRKKVRRGKKFRRGRRAKKKEKRKPGGRRGIKEKRV